MTETEITLRLAQILNIPRPYAVAAMFGLAFLIGVGLSRRQR